MTEIMSTQTIVHSLRQYRSTQRVQSRETQYIGLLLRTTKWTKFTDHELIRKNHFANHFQQQTKLHFPPRGLSGVIQRFKLFFLISVKKYQPKNTVFPGEAERRKTRAWIYLFLIQLGKAELFYSAYCTLLAVFFLNSENSFCNSNSTLVPRTTQRFV